MRYHRDLDYSDFSEDDELIAKVKRAESYRAWADIEDVANGLEALATNFTSHQTTAASAFTELFNHIEKFKKDFMFKVTEVGREFTAIKTEFQDVREEMREIEKQKASVTIDDIQILRKKIFEMRDT